MDVNTIDLRPPGEHATNLGEPVPDPRGRVTVSRARAVLAFLRAETLTAVNAVSQSGLMAAGGVFGRARSRIPSQAGSRFWG